MARVSVAEKLRANLATARAANARLMDMCARETEALAAANHRIDVLRMQLDGANSDCQVARAGNLVHLETISRLEDELDAARDEATQMVDRYAAIRAIHDKFLDSVAGVSKD